MSNRLILDPSYSPIQPAFDPYWDNSPTRRELQKAFNKLGSNDSEIMLMIDNLNLVTNCLCEKFGVTKGEIEVYVTKKVTELKDMQGNQVDGVKDVIPNG